MIQAKITSYLVDNHPLINNQMNNKKRKNRADDELETGLVKRICKLNISKQNSIPQNTIKNKVVTDFIVYKHENIDILLNVKKDSYSVIANKYIPAGTLLILENAIIGTNEYIYTVLNNRKDIIKELYPRNGSDSLHFIPKENVVEKIIHNVWEWNDSKSPISLEDMSALCPVISKFNHSCKPNAFTRCFSNKEIDEVEEVENAESKGTFEEYKGYLFVYSVSNILEGEEITISYGFNIGHSYKQMMNSNNDDENMIIDEGLLYSEDDNEVFNWICHCNKSKKERFQYFRNAYREAKRYWEEDKDMLITLINNK